MEDLRKPVGLVPAQDLEAAYGDFPIGIVVTGANGQVVFANGVARTLFFPLEPTDVGFRTLLALSGVTGAGELVSAVERHNQGAPTRIGLPGGRAFEGATQPLADGRVLVTLFDVTTYLQGAEPALADPLTGLSSQADFQKRLADALAEGRRGNTSTAVIHIGLDKFKTVNDALGHSVGDALLIKVAERIRSAARTGDMIARLRGDEFAVLQIGAPQPEAAEVLAARLVDLVGRAYIAAGHMLTIGASVGIAIGPDHGHDAASVMKHAGLALFRAKADGRGLFRIFEGSMDVEMQSRRLLEMDLRKALAMKEFELFYQPQVDIRSKTLIGFEALLRWRSPGRGLVSPGVFVPLAEAVGLIGRIGDWVLQTACREAASWPSSLTVGVNISPLQFGGGKLVPTVVSALEASGLDAARLDLEITENSLLDNTDTTLQTLQELKAMGIHLSMDDFGTGYSSLSYLQKFPFDKIKIDQSFVRGADHSAGSGAIVRAVVALGNSLGMKTIAEGVETEEQLDRVSADGCDEVQGYLTGRPMPAAEAASLMRGAPVADRSKAEETQ